MVLARTRVLRINAKYGPTKHALTHTWHSFNIYLQFALAKTRIPHLFCRRARCQNLHDTEKVRKIRKTNERKCRGIGIVKTRRKKLQNNLVNYSVDKVNESVGALAYAHRVVIVLFFFSFFFLYSLRIDFNLHICKSRICGSIYHHRVCE